MGSASDTPGHVADEALHGLFRPHDAHHHAHALADALGQVFQAVLGDDLAVVDNDHAVANIGHLVEDVRGEHHGVVVAKVANQAADLDDLAWIQADGGFVHDDHVRIAHQRLARPTRCL